MKQIALLGSTGSIGIQALHVISQYPQLFRVQSLTANRQFRELAMQARKFKPSKVAIGDKSCYNELKAELVDLDRSEERRVG